MPNWNEVLRELNAERDRTASPLDAVRRRYLNTLFEHTGRNVIAYYSGFLSKPGIQLLDINDEDMNGFMMAVHRLDRSRGLDLFLHTPGGSIASTQAIVRYLQMMFDCNIRAVVPQIAMSAGTMIACSCKSILLGKQSSLGPVNPHVRGIPAAAVLKEFQQALQECRAEPAAILVWREILQQYRPTFLSQCQQAIAWTKQFVEGQLESVMFAGETDAKVRAASVFRRLSDYRQNKTHERHISPAECQKIGLKVEMIEGDNSLQDLVLTIHHCYMHTLMNSPAFKIIENHLGTALIKNQAIRAAG
ncbi:MAG: S49 family peptidase [Acidobacteria bacterium]|nr:S49 family peptidase [Acidobacteriota bacterium]